MIDKRARSESASSALSTSPTSSSPSVSNSTVGKILSSFQQNQLSRLSLSGVPESAVPLEKNALSPSTGATAAPQNVTAAHIDRQKLPRTSGYPNKRPKLTTATSSERLDQATLEADNQAKLKAQELSGRLVTINKASSDIQSKPGEGSNTDTTPYEKANVGESPLTILVAGMKEQPKKNQQNNQTPVSHPILSMLDQPNPSKRSKRKKKAQQQQQSQQQKQQANASVKKRGSQPKADNKQKDGKQATANQQQSSSKSEKGKGAQNNVTQKAGNSVAKPKQVSQANSTPLDAFDLTMATRKDSLTMRRTNVMETVCKQLNEVIQKHGEMSGEDEKRARLLISIHNEMREAVDSEPKL